MINGNLSYAIETNLRTLEEAINGADVFLGLSAKGALKKELVKTMAKNPIIFACANPDPEITPEEINEVRDDAISCNWKIRLSKSSK